MCGARDHACGTPGTGTPVDLPSDNEGTGPAMADDAEIRWVNLSTRSGRENWAKLKLRRTDPQWEGSLPADARKSPGGGPVVRDLVRNKARATSPGSVPVKAAKTKPTEKIDPDPAA